MVRAEYDKTGGESRGFGKSLPPGRSDVHPLRRTRAELEDLYARRPAGGSR
jgi:hypothetical protein